MQVQHQGLKVIVEELGGQVHLVAAGGAEFKPNQLDLGEGRRVREGPEFKSNELDLGKKGRGGEG